MTESQINLHASGDEPQQGRTTGHAELWGLASHCPAPTCCQSWAPTIQRTRVRVRQRRWGDGGITAPSLVTGLTHHHPRSLPAADHPQKLQVLEECLYVQQAHEKIPTVATYERNANHTPSRLWTHTSRRAIIKKCLNNSNYFFSA